MTIKRMDNVGIVVESLDAAISFFSELGLTLEGRAMIEGDWSGRVTGVHGQRVEIAMMRTPDGHSKLELSQFLTPKVVADHRNAPVNALGYLRVMFTVEDLDEPSPGCWPKAASSSTRWSSTRTPTGSATSARPTGCCSGSRRSSVEPHCAKIAVAIGVSSDALLATRMPPVPTA